MTRYYKKDFERTATALNKDVNHPSITQALDTLCLEFRDIFKEDNPRFDAERF